MSANKTNVGPALVMATCPVCGSVQTKAWMQRHTTNAVPSAKFTRSQQRVVAKLWEGKSNKIIAFELGIEINTVKAHLVRIMRKLDVHSRAQVVLLTRPSAR